MAIDRCYFKKVVAIVLPDCRVILRSRSFTNDSVRGLKTPVDSTEIGIIICECDGFEYFASLDVANVSEQVVSHTRGFPADQGMVETPSGRFPSTFERPRGSSCEGMLAEARALWMMSFKAGCLEDLPFEN